MAGAVPAALRGVPAEMAAQVSACQGDGMEGAVEIPVIGMGGIASGRHAAEFLAAGATAVAVGTESFRDPAAGRRIAAELADLSLSGKVREPASTPV